MEEEQVRRRRCIARVRVSKAGFDLALEGQPTFLDVATLSMEVGLLADQLERELAPSVPMEKPTTRHTGEVVYGVFQGFERGDLRPAARAVNAAP